MRVTNNMIMKTSKGNINSTKVGVNDKTNQMTTQKKISRPSEDPVVAVRALRFATSLSKLNQYNDNNIPDAEKWLDTTETALLNMTDLIKDFRTQCVNGSTGTLTTSDRSTILNQLTALQQSIYQEGDSDYAGRTVFTGYRTDTTLTFQDASNQTYEIKQDLSYNDMESGRYYTGAVTVPTTEAEINAYNTADADIDKSEFSRLRLPYDDVSQINGLTISFGGNDYEFTMSEDTDADGTIDNYFTKATADVGQAPNNVATTVLVFDTEADWAAYQEATRLDDDNNVLTGKNLRPNEIAIIKSTGEMVFGQDIAEKIQTQKASIAIDYDKTGFNKGELKPEFYYNCIDKTTVDPIVYNKFETDGSRNYQEINYNIAANQTMTVNIEASDVFDSSIIQDINDMINAVTSAQAAADKVDKIKSMKQDAAYASDECQEKLDKWLDAAQKEMDYYDDNLQKMFSSNISKADSYINDISLSLTKVGCKADQLEITSKRVGNQIETVSELQSLNEDVDLSQIIIEYTASYTAYQASLTAAGKLGEISLLNYI